MQLPNQNHVDSKQLRALPLFNFFFTSGVTKLALQNGSVCINNLNYYQRQGVHSETTEPHFCFPLRKAVSPSKTHKAYCIPLSLTLPPLSFTYMYIYPSSSRLPTSHSKAQTVVSLSQTWNHFNSSRISLHSLYLFTAFLFLPSLCSENNHIPAKCVSRDQTLLTEHGTSSV